jgi:transporter family-2 protein
MSKLFIMLLTLIAGVGIGSQAAINGALGKKVGSLEGAFLSFLIGTIGLSLVMIFFGKGNVLAGFQVPKWNLLGGLLGAIYIAIMVMVVPKIGVGLSVVSIIVGQIVMSMAIDHYGLFGGGRIPFDGYRFFGTLLLLFALLLIFRGSIKSF